MPLFSGRRRDPGFSRAVVGTIVLLVAVYAVDLVGDLRLAYQWALMPGELIAGLRRLPSDPLNGQAWMAIATIWTSVLVHAGIMHLAFNALYFYFFGTLLAQLVGDRAVIVTLLLTSVTSGAAFAIHHGEASPAFVIGASGAISGVAGLFVLLSFRWEDSPLVYTWPLARPVAPVQAALLALFSAGMDVYVLRLGGVGGTAVDAHVGGFAGGLVLGAVLTTFYPTWDAYLSSAIGPGPKRGS